MAHCPQSDFLSCKPCFILLKSSPVVRPASAWERGIDTVTLRSVNQATLLPSSFRKSMITLLVQPCTVTTAAHSHAPFFCLMWGLFSGRGESPLRIGCKVSVMVTRSGVVLDNVTRWKWVKEIGNHQYAPCVNWRRSWFMAPGYSVHTCWIYSFFFLSLCRLAQGQVRVPFSAAHPHHRAVRGTLWWTALRMAAVFQNELSAIYRQPLECSTERDVH